MQVTTEDLFNADDVKKIRTLLYKEQDGLCKLACIPVALKDCHLDHKHDEEQLVRGTLYKQSNMVLGKLESLWVRYLSYWYPHDLPTFLRMAANYLESTEQTPDRRYRHPGWIKRCQILFNKLTTKQRDSVLLQLGYTERCMNDVQRKKIFAIMLKDKKLGYTTVLTAINKTKG